MSDFNRANPWVRPRTHGTLKAYKAGCHCDACRAANAEYWAKWNAGPEAYATASEVREWFRGLGFDLPRVLPAPAIARWDREHPERPYRGAAR